MDGTGKYKIVRVLGEGAFGKVVEAIDQSSQAHVAVKQIKTCFKSWDECVNLRELKALKALRHKRIVRCVHTESPSVLPQHLPSHLTFPFLSPVSPSCSDTFPHRVPPPSLRASCVCDRLHFRRPFAAVRAE